MRTYIWVCERETALPYSPPVGEQHAFPLIAVRDQVTGMTVFSLCQEVRVTLGTELAHRWVWTDRAVYAPEQCQRCQDVVTMMELAK